jgi:hypothetical protein
MNLIQAENLKPGSRAWLLDKVNQREGLFRQPEIEGFASPWEVETGQRIEFKVSCDPASEFTLDLYRLGYYQGRGGRLVASLGPFKGHPQPQPEITSDGLATCAWKSCHSLTIPSDWPSGVYFGKLQTLPGEARRSSKSEVGWQSHLVFLVRDRRQADFNFQCATNTWAAYNRWPQVNSSYDKDGDFWYWGPGTRVGWQRPFGFPASGVTLPPTKVGSGEFPLWEFPLAYWMEKEGYDVTYTSNHDTHTDGAGLMRTRAFLSIGHDEYWSNQMMDNLKAALAKGLNAAFLCGNALYGVVEYDATLASTTRTGIFGPLEEKVVGIWPAMSQFKQWGPDAAEVMGVRSVFPVVGLGDWTCTDPEHWLFEGTGMKKGDSVQGLIGWEFHGVPWPHPGLKIVAEGRAQEGGPVGHYSSVVFQHPGGGTIFNAATIWWPQALSEPPGHTRPLIYSERPTGLQGPDSRVQRITKNLFEKFLK